MAYEELPSQSISCSGGCMTEQIKLPAQEWLGYDPEQGDMHGYTFDQMREFTKLIIGECCAILNEMHSWQTMNNQEYSSTWHDAVDQGIDQIKEHFGVEE